MQCTYINLLLHEALLFQYHSATLSDLLSMLRQVHKIIIISQFYDSNRQGYNICELDQGTQHSTISTKASNNFDMIYHCRKHETLSILFTLSLLITHRPTIVTNIEFDIHSNQQAQQAYSHLKILTLINRITGF